MLMVTSAAAFPSTAAAAGRLIIRTVAAGIAAVVILINETYVFWAGEINANRSFLTALQAVLPATPLQRAMLIHFTLPQDFALDRFNYDRNRPLQIAVLAQINQPLSPLVGSRAQNRLYLSSTVGELVNALKAKCPHFAVITKEKPAPVTSADRSTIERIGYQWAVDGDRVAVARRVSCKIAP
jgi:hypothetical protein